MLTSKTMYIGPYKIVDSKENTEGDILLTLEELGEGGKGIFHDVYSKEMYEHVVTKKKSDYTALAEQRREFFVKRLKEVLLHHGVELSALVEGQMSELQRVVTLLLKDLQDVHQLADDKLWGKKIITLRDVDKVLKEDTPDIPAGK